MTKNERMIRVAVPKYDDFYGVLLKFLADGAIHTVEDCQNFVRDDMILTDADLAELKSDGQLKWLARVEWCLELQLGIKFRQRDGLSNCSVAFKATFFVRAKNFSKVLLPPPVRVLIRVPNFFPTF